MDEQRPQVPAPLRRNVLITSVDAIYNWGRVYSLWPMMFGLACCAIEMIAAAAARFDFSRFGMELMRASPRQADLMIVSGTVTKKMAPQVVRLYNQMPEPKYVLAMGACACSGGPFKEGYNVVSGVDKLLPVDVYIPGCPPRPEALIHGFQMIHDKIRGESVTTVRWYSKEPVPPCSVPWLGPDLVDPRQVPAIKEMTAAARAAHAANGGESVQEERA
ncbi:MAG: NADH-quinone oxidoreductase subunit B [Chloroflexi bacterium]|nr:NADH-quinone oxidoreductase subunit B [Chloroflexota bacterium]